MLGGLPKKKKRKKKHFSAQHVQNTAAPKVLTRTRNKAHITPVLKSLHRLPLNSGVYFKIILLVFKALNSLAPEYNQHITSLVAHQPQCSLRSADAGFLFVSKVHYKKSFLLFLCAQTGTPYSSRSERLQVLNIFKSNLKTHLCMCAFN